MEKMRNKTTNKKLLSGLTYLVISLALVLTFSIFVSADQFKDYIGNPTAPKQSNLKSDSSFTVSLFDGSATSNYQIELPQGTNGLTPQISLTYISSSSPQPPNILGTAKAN